MRVLVTGGSGYLGSLVCEELTKRGHYVVSVDRKLPAWSETPIAYVQDDFDNLSITFVRSFETIVHLAAMTSIVECERDYEKSYEENVLKTASLARKSHMGQHFVFASSSAIYGDQGGKKVKWKDVKMKSQYSATKFLAEKRLDDSSTALLRLATLWGFSPSLRNGILVHDAIKQMREEGRAVVYDPDTVRPYMNVRDCALYILFVIESKKTGHINVGTETLNKRDVISKLAETFELPVQVETGNGFIQDFRMPTRFLGKRLFRNYQEALWASAYLSRHSGEQIGQPSVSIKS